MVQTRAGASNSKWITFMRKVGVAWRQGKRELLLVLMQEILEDNDEVACETTLDALRDLLDRTKISSDEYFSVQNS